MHLTQDHPGHYWKTDDPLALPLNEYGPEPPQSIHCYMMYDLAGRGGMADVAVKDLEFLAAGIFGAPRGDKIKWSGDSHRYGIYRLVNEFSSPDVVVLEAHGGGMVGYHFHNCGAIEMWKSLVKTASPEMLWDVCHTIANACTTSRQTVASQYRKAIVEKRVKVHRHAGRARVEILAPAIAAR